MKNISSAVTDSGCKDIQPGGFLPVKVKENCSVPKVSLYTLESIFPNTFKKWVPRRYPLKGWIISQKFFIKDNLLIFAS